MLSSLVNRITNKHVSFGVEPDHYPVVGTILLQTMEEVLGKKVFNDEVKAAVTDAYFYLADIFIKTEEKMKKEKEEAIGGWYGWRKMIVEKKVKETHIHTSFYLAPQDGRALLISKPGQYISIRVKSSPYNLVRNYSLSWTSSRQYRITVKREVEGKVSTYLHEELEEGQVLEVGVPCGNFVLTDDDKPLVLIGAGIGVTPLISIARQAAELKRKVGKKQEVFHKYSMIENHCWLTSYVINSLYFNLGFGFVSFSQQTSLPSKE